MHNVSTCDYMCHVCAQTLESYLLRHSPKNTFVRWHHTASAVGGWSRPVATLLPPQPFAHDASALRNHRTRLGDKQNTDGT